jgi:hypothetical protein
MSINSLLPHSYDSWRLDNGEPDFCICQECGEKKDPQEFVEFEGAQEMCEDCAEKNGEFCPTCQIWREPTSWSHGHDEMCDHCIDRAVDRMVDRD